jgi:hypothetical protein
MTGVCEIKHAPERRIRIGLGNLEEGEVRRVGGRKRKFVYRGYDPSIGD